MWSGFGTVFFQLIIGQLVYASRYNLLPIIHLGNSSLTVHDPIVHGRNHVNQREVSSLSKYKYLYSIPNIKIPKIIPDIWYPGPPPPPPPPQRGSNPKTTNLQLDGSGLWNHYFQELPFCSGDENLPLYSMTPDQVSPGLFFHAPWSPKAWRYDRIPTIVQKPYLTFDEWIRPQRQLASKIVQTYYRVQPSILKEVQAILPVTTGDCLGLHIRWSDKKIARRILGVDEFLPYVVAYVQHYSKPCIYLATDSWLVWDEIQATWPKNILSHVYQQPTASLLRSNNTRHVADLGSHHQVNHQTLVDIVALSRCSFLIHGHSAVSESAIYLNPLLIDRSVNLEDPNRFLSNATLLAKVIVDPSLLLLSRPVAWWNHGLQDIPQCPSSDSPNMIHLTQRDTDGYFLSTQQWTTQIFVELVHQLVFQGTAIVDPMLSYWFDNIDTDCFISWKPTNHQLWNDTTSKTLLSSVRIRQNYGTTSTANVDVALVRRLMHDVLSKTLQPRSFLMDQVPQSLHCLGVWIEDPGHIMDSNKLQPRSWPRTKYYQYISDFQQAGGECIYVATESNEIWKQLTQDWWGKLKIHTRADVVRNHGTTKAHWMIDQVERLGSETLLEILSLAMVCDVLLHGPHAMADAALYWNPQLLSIPIVGLESSNDDIRFETWLKERTALRPA